MSWLVSKVVKFLIRIFMLIQSSQGGSNPGSRSNEIGDALKRGQNLRKDLNPR